MFDGECAKEQIMDLQERFPEAFEEILHKNGYLNLIWAAQDENEGVRLAAIKTLQHVPDVSDGGALAYLAVHGPDEATREAALASLKARAKE